MSTTTPTTPATIQISLSESDRNNLYNLQVERTKRTMANANHFLQYNQFTSQQLAARIAELNEDLELLRILEEVPTPQKQEEPKAAQEPVKEPVKTPVKKPGKNVEKTVRKIAAVSSDKLPGNSSSNLPGRKPSIHCCLNCANAMRTVGADFTCKICMELKDGKDTCDKWVHGKPIGD